MIRISADALTDRERTALGGLRSDADRLMLQRSYAALLLKYRGHRLPNLEDFAMTGKARVPRRLRERVATSGRLSLWLLPDARRASRVFA